MKKKRKQEKEESFYRPAADPQGMYTGVPEDPKEIPVQDADDL